MSDSNLVRQKRLSVALRENLKRRKSQSRGRTAPPKIDTEAETDAPETADDDA